MNFKHCFKYIFLLLIATDVSAHSRCVRCDPNDPQYVGMTTTPDFYDTETTCEILDTFLAKLEIALKKDDPDQVAELLCYPCRWNISNHQTIQIKNKAQFKRLYRKIFTDKVKRDAIEAEVSEVGYRGFMIKHGTIWFLPKHGIYVINRPREENE